MITYFAVAPGIFSEQTLIPLERVVESIIIIIKYQKLISPARVCQVEQVGSNVLTEWSDVLQRLWDFSEWELSEVLHDRFFRELHELFLGLNSE